jgi:hypothetical protein
VESAESISFNHPAADCPAQTGLAVMEQDEAKKWKGFDQKA